MLNPTEADHIQLLAMTLSESEERGGCGLGNLEHQSEDPNHDPRIDAVFPLHNHAWRNKALNLHWKRNFSTRARLAGACARWKCRRRSRRVGSSDEAQDPADAGVPRGVQSATERARGALGTAVYEEPREAGTASASTPRRLLERSQSAMQPLLKRSQSLIRAARHQVDKLHRSLREQMVDELSPHEAFLSDVNTQYGERFAFLFAFTEAASQSLVALVWLMMAAILLDLLGGPDTFHTYLRTTGVVGLLIPCVWRPWWRNVLETFQLSSLATGLPACQVEKRSWHNILDTCRAVPQVGPTFLGEVGSDGASTVEHVCVTGLAPTHFS